MTGRESAIRTTGTGGMERLCCAFHFALPRARIHVAGKPFESQGFMSVSLPAHTKIFRILGEKRLCGVEDVTRWRSSPFSGFVGTRGSDLNTLSMDSGLRSQLSRAYSGPKKHSLNQMSRGFLILFSLRPVVHCHVHVSLGFFPAKSSPRQHCEGRTRYFVIVVCWMSNITLLNGFASAWLTVGLPFSPGRCSHSKWVNFSLDAVQQSDCAR